MVNAFRGSQSAGIPVDSVDDAISALIGPLHDDEKAKVFGAVHAWSSSDPLHREAALPLPQVQDLAGVIARGRYRMCSYCHHHWVDHDLVIEPGLTMVGCPDGSQVRSAAQWLAGPAPVAPLRVAGGVALWVFLPFISMGLLSWLPSLVGAVTRRRRQWIAASGVLGALTLALVLMLSLPDASENPSAATGFVALGLWIGSSIYGALQVKEWASPAEGPVPGSLRVGGSAYR